MKVSQLAAMLEAARQLVGEGAAARDALDDATQLLDGRGSLTVPAFVKRLEGVAADHGARDAGGRSSALPQNLKPALTALEAIAFAAGAKAAVKDLRLFAAALEARPTTTISGLRQALDAASRKAKPARASKATAATSRKADPAKVEQHVTRLRDAGTDRMLFAAALADVDADHTIRAADLGEIARGYALSAVKYKSAAAARADIERAFVRQARFENKIR